MTKNNFVLDTNIWISAIITNTVSWLEKYILDHKLIVYICPEMILELQDALKRPKFKKYLNKSIAELYFKSLCRNNVKKRFF